MDDKYVCSFYQRIGACRHGEKCSRRHVAPLESHTILLSNLLQNTKSDPASFDDFYSDVFVKAAAAGKVEDIVVCENENFHLNGNVYVAYHTTQAASAAVNIFNQEWFAGRPVYCELSPVTSFADANCRAHDKQQCLRGGQCNFMHLRRPLGRVKSTLHRAQDKTDATKKLQDLESSEVEKPRPESGSDPANGKTNQPESARVGGVAVSNQASLNNEPSDVPNATNKVPLTEALALLFDNETS